MSWPETGACHLKQLLVCKVLAGCCCALGAAGQPGDQLSAAVTRALLQPLPSAAFMCCDLFYSASFSERLEGQGPGALCQVVGHGRCIGGAVLRVKVASSCRLDFCFGRAAAFCRGRWLLSFAYLAVPAKRTLVRLLK